MTRSIRDIAVTKIALNIWTYGNYRTKYGKMQKRVLLNTAKD